MNDSSNATSTGARADYGIDAPGVIRNLLLAGLACLLAAVAAPSLRWLVSPAISFLATAALMLYSSKWGKLRLRDKLLDQIAWRGNEKALDVGCGSGLLLVGAARRVPHGSATGVDVWSQKDLGGNRPDKPLKNAKIEQVAGRVMVESGDARRLPFADECFDVVVTLNVLHNIPERSGREQAISEVVRVLGPGGRILLCDFRNTGAYAARLRELGLRDARRQFIAWVGIFPMCAAVATKPAG